MSYRRVLERMGVAPTDWCKPSDNEWNYLSEDERFAVALRHHLGKTPETCLSGDLHKIYEKHILRCEVCGPLLQDYVQENLIN